MQRVPTLILWLLSLTVAALPASALGQSEPEGENDEIGFSGTIHTGPSVVFGSPDGDIAFHLDIYPGYEVFERLDLELNFGFRTSKDSAGNLSVRTTAIPLLLPGARYHFKPPDSQLRPYVHGHLGIGVIRTKVSSTVQGMDLSSSDATPTFTFNYGAGAYYAITPDLYVGGGVTLRHHFDTATINYFDMNLGVRLNF